MGRIVTDLQELCSQLDRLRQAGKSIVLANGNFDLWHVGHTRYLRAAAQQGDVLVVAVNSDASVRAAKGAPRPVHPLSERMEIVAGVAGVDYVTCFDAPTCDELLMLVRPHKHVKGPDYTSESLPERHTLRRIGARLVIVGDPKAHSSSEILNRIRRGADN
ncbi:MAG: adenylyltransferase/cytidyltransferase family protein [Phycisphaerae bacterium]